jgi:hypothetical protein
VRIPRLILLPACAVLTVAAYSIFLLTNWGNPYHGGSYFGTVATEVLMVLAAFACLEVVRTETVVALRAVAAAVGFPLLLVLLLTLWIGLRRYFAA